MEWDGWLCPEPSIVEESETSGELVVDNYRWMEENDLLEKHSVLYAIL